MYRYSHVLCAPPDGVVLDVVRLICCCLSYCYRICCLVLFPLALLSYYIDLSARCAPPEGVVLVLFRYLSCLYNNVV